MSDVFEYLPASSQTLAQWRAEEEAKRVADSNLLTANDVLGCLGAQPTAGIKHDGGKPPMSLLDRRALELVAQVLAHGAEKYGRHNWRNGIEASRLADAALRHIFAWVDGETADPESGLPHIAHAMCSLMFLLSLAETRPDLDDRSK